MSEYDFFFPVDNMRFAGLVQNGALRLDIRSTGNAEELSRRATIIYSLLEQAVTNAGHAGYNMGRRDNLSDHHCRFTFEDTSGLPLKEALPVIRKTLKRLEELTYELQVDFDEAASALRDELKVAGLEAKRAHLSLSAPLASRVRRKGHARPWALAKDDLRIAIARALVETLGADEIRPAVDRLMDRILDAQRTRSEQTSSAHKTAYEQFLERQDRLKQRITLSDSELERIILTELSACPVMVEAPLIVMHDIMPHIQTARNHRPGRAAGGA